MQNHATVKDMQRHLRHTDPQTTLKHYAKVIPESLRSAVAALHSQIMGGPLGSRTRVPENLHATVAAVDAPCRRCSQRVQTAAPVERSSRRHRNQKSDTDTERVVSIEGWRRRT